MAVESQSVMKGSRERERKTRRLENDERERRVGMRFEGISSLLSILSPPSSSRESRCVRVRLRLPMLMLVLDLQIRSLSLSFPCSPAEIGSVIDDYRSHLACRTRASERGMDGSRGTDALLSDLLMAHTE